MLRWQVTFYGPGNHVIKEVSIDEIDELPDIVEAGPPWYELDRIEIRYTN